MTRNSRSFTVAFVSAQAIRHCGLIISKYISAESSQKSFDAVQFVRKDFARPLFEHDFFCDGYVSYASAQAIAIGLEMPAYVAASLVHLAFTGEWPCVFVLTTPRGHAITLPFVVLLWALVARLSMRFPSSRMLILAPGIWAFASLPLLAFSLADLVLPVISIALWLVCLAGVAIGRRQQS